jgi:hypothetical protein
MSEWYRPGAPADNDDGALTKSPEDAAADVADRFGVGAAMLVLCVGLLLAAVWFFNSPSFEKCSAAQNVTERLACYDQLRQALFKPPAKGAEMPSDLR